MGPTLETSTPGRKNPVHVYGRNYGGWDSMAPWAEQAFAGRLNAQMQRFAENKALARQQRNAAVQAAACGMPIPPGYCPPPGGRPIRGEAGCAPACPPVGNPFELARGDDVYYGLDSGAAGIAGATTATLSTTPQKRHIPKRMTVSAQVAANFVVSAIQVGVEPVLATTSNMSMAVFIQDATSPSFRAVVCEIGMDFSVTVTNINAAVAARFTAAIVGTYLPPAGYAGW